MSLGQITSLSPRNMQQNASLFNNLEASIKKGDFAEIAKFCDIQSEEEKLNAFHHFCSSNAFEFSDLKKCLEIFLKFIDVNSMSFSKQTALHIACQTKNFPLAKFLIKHEADRDVKNNASKTPLDIATEQKCDDIVKLLKKEDLIFLEGLNIFTFLKRCNESMVEAEKASNVKASFIIGGTGAGKSTFINWKSGCPYKKEKADLKAGGKELIPIEKQSSSDTSIFKTYNDIIDGPGFFDTRGGVYQISESAAFCKLLEAGVIKNLIFAIPATHFDDDRLIELRKDCERFGEMVASYENICNSIYFVITKYDKVRLVWQEEEATIAGKIKGKLNLLEKQHNNDDYDIIHLLKIMENNPGNIFLADYKFEDQDLRKGFIDKLKQMPALPDGALRLNNQHGRMVKLQKLVDCFFRKIVDSSHENMQKKDILVMKKKRISQKEQQINVLASQIVSEQSQFIRPKEGPKPNDELLQYCQNEITRLENEKKGLENHINNLANQIVNIENNPQEGVDKSLKDLIKERAELQKKIDALNVKDEEEFYRDLFKETRMTFFGIFSWSKHTFSYSNREMPFSTANLTTTTGSKTIDTDKKDEGQYQAQYITKFGEDGDAELIIKGQKKVKFKKEIECLEGNTSSFGIYIDEYNKLVDGYRKSIEQGSQRISQINQEINNFENEKKDITRQYNQKQLNFEEEITKIEKEFNDKKNALLKQLEIKKTENEKTLAEIRKEKEIAQKEEAIAAKRYLRITKKYGQKDIEQMSEIVKIAMINPSSLAEYRMVQMFQKDDSIDDLFHHSMKEPVRHINCNKIFEKEYIMKILSRKYLCPFCKGELKNEQLKSD